MLTNEGLQEVLKAREDLQRLLEPYEKRAQEVHRLRTQVHKWRHGGGGYFESWNDSGTFTIECGCCGSSDWESYPVEYLWLEDWELEEIFKKTAWR